MPSLSILLPTYNGVAYLPQQLDSILGQSAGDFELLAIDDGSSDATVALIDEYAARDSRIRRLESRGNAGQVNRLAELVGAARGDLICFADQDDIWDLDKNARLIAGLGDRPMAFGRSELIDGSGTALGRTLLDAVDSTPEPAMRLRSLMRPMVSAHGMIVRRDWLTMGAFYGAVPFDMALALEAMFGDGLAYVDDAIVHHRIHGGNQMNGSATQARATKAISRARLIESVSRTAPRRLQLWLSLDQLGRSARLAPALRNDLRRLAADCYAAWFAPWRGLEPFNARVRDRLHAVLDPWAGCPADRAYFDLRVGEMTRPGWHPLNLRAAIAAYRGRAPA